MIKYNKTNAIKGKFYITKKILHFPQPQDYITDDDILSLFKGLIDIVKKNTEVKLEHKYENIVDALKNELQELKNNN